ncbi:MAG: DUF262 domain-containing protein [Acidimicrobiales bacterium]
MDDLEPVYDDDDEEEPPTDSIANELEDWDEPGEPPEEIESIWEQRQRELLTSVLDYNLNTLADLVTANQIDLSPRYQRRDRWKPERQSRLIESFLMNVPVPPIFLNEDDYGKYSVIDGKQRLTAIHNFMRGRLRLKGLKVFKELNGNTIDDMSVSLRNIIATRANLRATIILRQSDNDVKFEVFRRLNTGGVSLNAQEIRNSTWPGPLNDLLLDLSEDATFRSILGITRPPTSAVYKEMRDVELVLRYFTFKDDWATFSGGMSRRLDEFMATNQRLDKITLSEMRTSFLNALTVSHLAFGKHAFRRYMPERRQWRAPILAALFDAQMFSGMSYTPAQVQGRSRALVAAYQALFSDPEFRRAIDAATNTPALFRRRIQLLQRVFESVVTD